MAASCAGRTASLACLAMLALVALAIVAGRLALVTVGGGSMAPALWPGDVCVVSALERPSVSDVVLYTPPGHRTRVLHRVYREEGDMFVTRGDANPIADREPVPRSAVFGRVAAVLPVGRVIHRWQVASGR